MRYKLRHFENNNQAVASLGWVFIILGLVNLFISPLAVGVVFLLLGSALVFLQLRGKRIIVDTQAKHVISGGKTVQLQSPTQIFMNEVRVSQRVSSRGSSTNVKSYFYKAYITDGEEHILISCNRNDERDADALQSIANDLGVPFVKNFEG